MTLTHDDRQEIINYRIEKAFETYREAEFVVSGGFWNLAANRLYYSIYYACIALLIKNQMTATTHTGVCRMINLHFVYPGILTQDDGKLLKRLFRMRQTGDYDDLYDWSKDEIEPYLYQTKILLEKLCGLALAPRSNQPESSGENTTT